MKIKHLYNGIATFYEDFTIWVSKIERGAEGYVIFNDEDPLNKNRKKVYKCEIEKVIRRRGLSESAYNEVILNTPSSNVSGEFITDDDTYYIFVKTGKRGDYFDDVYFNDAYEC